MRQVLVIFEKDARRFWWEIAVTLSILAATAWQDINRYDFIQGPVESLLTVLLAAAWTYLVALAIQEEALVGDRQFWLTRPIPRSSLVGAKLLFALAFVHLPALLADSAILVTHGFQPLAWLPQLAWKQFIVVAAVTLPAAALAAVTRNIPQFAMIAVPLALSAILLSGSVEGTFMPWLPVETTRRALAIGVLAAAAIVILAIQYRTRRAFAAWTVWVLALVSAGTVYAWLPRSFSLGAQNLATGYSILFAPEVEAREPAVPLPRFTDQIAIPIRVSGWPGVPDFTQEIAGPTRVSDITGSTATFAPLPYLFPEVDLEKRYARVQLRRDGTGWIYLFGPRHGTIVRLRGAVKVEFFRRRERGSLSTTPSAATMPGIGRCSTTGSLKVLCESPSPIPRGTPVDLRSPAREKPWCQYLGDSMPLIPYYWGTWLSPLHRRQTYFQLIPQVSTAPVSSWLVPKIALEQGMVVFSTLEPDPTSGRIDFDLRDIRVRDYVISSYP